MTLESTKLARCTLLLVCSLLGVSAALAQPEMLLETVATRERESLDPLGIRTGSFQIFPELSFEGFRDDNIFATPVEEISDTAMVLSPAVTLRSDWNRNALSFGINASSTSYSDFDNEDHDDSELFIRGRWDTASDGYFYGALTSSTEHEDRESADDARGLERTRVDRDRASMGYRIEPGRIVLQAELESEGLDYHDVLGINGVINQDDRDRERRTGRLRAGYEVSEGYAVFVQLLDKAIEYDRQFDRNGFERSSEGYEAVVGAEVEISEVVSGDIFFGRKSHAYDDPRFSDIGGGTFGVSVSWNLSGLTTLEVEGRQEVSPTTILGASGIDETRFGIGVDHELLRNLILSLQWRKRDSDFKGIDRRDENRVVALGARYLMNRRLEIEFEYANRERVSTTSKNREFSKHVVSIRFTGYL